MVWKKIKTVLSENSWIYILGIIFLSLVLYWQTLHFGFVREDYIQDRLYSLKELVSTFYGTWDPKHIETDFYRPLVTLSYAANYFIWKTNPFGYHLTNVLLNTLNALLILFIMIKLGTKRMFSFVAAIMFLLIPYNSISVSWISHRSDIIMTLFFLISFLSFIIFYSKPDKRMYYLLSVLCFVFSLMSKEQAVTLPFILLFYAYIMYNDIPKRYLLSYFAILSSYMAFRFFIFSGIGGYGTWYPLWQAIPLNFCLAFFRTFVPFSEADLIYVAIYMPIIVIFLAFIASQIKHLHYRGHIFFSLSWITITILSLYSASFSRLLYLTSVGFGMLFGIICSELFTSFSKTPAECFATKNDIAKTVILVLLIISLFTLFAVVNMEHQDTLSPSSPMVLKRDQGIYVRWHDKMEDEQLDILKQKLDKYGLLDETEELLKQTDQELYPIHQEAPVDIYITDLYQKGGLNLVLKKILGRWLWEP
ncbi:MAG: hypothetical protein PHY36_00675 [Methanocellales archaeon]|nr:hypothetical protein [Methanocellales archaeon]MDD5446385.1 hypothetical protein [Methanocellales archaeon]